MGSPITLSGFNDIDFNQILNAVMTQERQPITRLQTQQTTLTSQKSAYATLATKLGALQTAIDKLTGEDSLAVLKATSSDSGVGVSTTSGTLTGTYSVVVSELARAQVLASSSSYASADTVVATGGALTIAAATGSPVAITLTGATTLAELAAAINNDTNSPVSAAVVQATPGHYKLVLTGKSTGADNAFTLTSTLTGGAGVTFTDTDNNQIYGDAAGESSQTAINSSFTVNGLGVQSASNTVTDVVPGVTLTLNKKDPLTTAVIGVTRDPEAARTLVSGFVTAYNALVDFAKDQTNAAVAGKASIARESLLRSFKGSIHSVLLDEYPSGNSFKLLAAVGLGFKSDGKMILDQATFNNAIANKPDDVQGLFSGTDGKGGAFGELSKLVTDYTSPGGLIAGATERIDTQVQSLNRRLDVMEAQLDIRRTSLQKQYTAADLAMTQLKSQGNSLSSLSNQYRLF